MQKQDKGKEKTHPLIFKSKAISSDDDDGTGSVFGCSKLTLSGCGLVITIWQSEFPFPHVVRAVRSIVINYLMLTGGGRCDFQWMLTTRGDGKGRRSLATNGDVALSTTKLHFVASRL